MHITKSLNLDYFIVSRNSKLCLIKWGQCFIKLTILVYGSLHFGRVTSYKIIGGVFDKFGGTYFVQFKLIINESVDKMMKLKQEGC